ncbi:TetR/AcrR family transcriptional regulator [Lutimonas saemankumensis]|uniref:TetR/AcrR family transcriptional regulator n=1 Tax=Lutimonas saemankumensis TaxID=483016 RepID=UPI001CD47789|nr:TetR/AcrR family transcriptional regulator [Lutimonas saemankumensis]MCA0931276.1 TetR/AcrR family transcriptional regulator [Lutimonas saemankumensis]
MRYKEYNTNRVLEKSIDLFWRKGFNGCSINDIVEATGVNRFSLYHEFNNKEGILYASLKLYKERYCEEKLELLKLNEDLTHTLKKFYASFWEDNKPMTGCYIIHVGTELADSDNRIKENLDNYLSEINSLLMALLIRNGYESNPDHYARHLVGLFCTIMSFCLIHSPEQRENYISNGINVILSKYGEGTK